MGLKKKVCWECKGGQYVFRQNADGEYDCEPCICLVCPREMLTDE